MADSLSSLAVNLDKSESCKSDLEYTTINDGSFVFKCVDWNINYERKFEEKFTKRFLSTCKFCNGGIDTFCLMLWKGIYS